MHTRHMGDAPGYIRERRNVRIGIISRIQLSPTGCLPDRRFCVPDIGAIVGMFTGIYEMDGGTRVGFAFSWTRPPKCRIYSPGHVVLAFCYRSFCLMLEEHCVGPAVRLVDHIGDSVWLHSPCTHMQSAPRGYITPRPFMCHHQITSGNLYHGWNQRWRNEV
jgi:hypothetical protein